MKGMVILKTKIKKIFACLRKNTQKLIKKYYYILDTKVHTTLTIGVIWVMLIWAGVAFDDNFKIQNNLKTSIIWSDNKVQTAVISDLNYIIVDWKKYKISLTEIK